MRAIVCRELGPPGVLRFEETPRPPLAAGGVRVRVAAAGVNFPDLLMVAGGYQLKPELPFIPGMEAAGTVIEIAADAAGAAGASPGDRVMVGLRFGAFAEEITAPAAAVAPIPAALDFAEAACFMVAYNTAYHGVMQRGGLRAGETLLVLGASGGVGLAAVELGRLIGARVIAAGSDDAKLAIVAARGADAVINLTREPLSDAVKALTDGRGADVVYDPVGGAPFAEALRAIAWGGRLLVIGFASGEIPTLRANLALLKGCSVIGVRAGENARRRPEEGQAARAALLGWAAAGRLRPHISHRLPLAQAAAALELLRDRKAVGRVALLTGAA